MSTEAKAFDEELKRYLQRGAQAVTKASGKQQQAIGFVMNVYRKLAASSAAAIHQALRRRRERLVREFEELEANSEMQDLAENDSRYEGEHEESMADGASREFFDGEIALLAEMIEKAGRLLAHDKKLQVFVEQMMGLIHAHDAEERILIFTEYRATQSYLKHALEIQFGVACVELIHGDQDYDQRREAISRFESEARFLISTEAGGEGINLQRRCHILVNYDLPWNPMRLAQRIGRLYRYGQQKPVLVFNMHAPETLDGSILNLLYQRLEQVVRDMASVGPEFRAGLEDEILGHMVELLDIQQVLENSASLGVQRTQQEIEEALRAARAAAELQNDLFRHVSGYDRSEAEGELRMTVDHLKSFMMGMFRQLGIMVVRRANHGMVLELEIPEQVLIQLPGWSDRERISFDRRWAAERQDVRVLDLDSELVRLTLAKAKEYRFGGWFSKVSGLDGGAFAATVLRWQTTQGSRMRQEFVSVQLSTNGTAVRNSSGFSKWLLEPASDSTRAHEAEEASDLLEIARQATEDRLSEICTAELHPENRQWVAAGWVG